MMFESGWASAKDFHHASAQLIAKTSWSTMGDVVQPQKAVPGRMAITGASKTASPVNHPCSIRGSNSLAFSLLSTKIIRAVMVH